MNTYIEADCMIKKSHAILGTPLRKNCDSERKKQKWLQIYSHRLFSQWFQWQTPLGITYSYAEQIREDLAKFYEDPLKRMFIEATYYSHLLDHGQY